jgi:hypothetical protein
LGVRLGKSIRADRQAVSTQSCGQSIFCRVHENQLLRRETFIKLEDIAVEKLNAVLIEGIEEAASGRTPRIAIQEILIRSHSRNAIDVNEKSGRITGCDKSRSGICPCDILPTRICDRERSHRAARNACDQPLPRTVYERH